MIGTDPAKRGGWRFRHRHYVGVQYFANLFEAARLEINPSTFRCPGAAKPF